MENSDQNRNMKANSQTAATTIEGFVISAAALSPFMMGPLYHIIGAINPL
jgi:hypothetical protein